MISETTSNVDDFEPETSTEAIKQEEKNYENLLPSNCGFENTNAIVGGETVALTEFPWLVLLEMQRKSE